MQEDKFEQNLKKIMNPDFIKQDEDLVWQRVQQKVYQNNLYHEKMNTNFIKTYFTNRKNIAVLLSLSCLVIIATVFSTLAIINGGSKTTKKDLVSNNNSDTVIKITDGAKFGTLQGLYETTAVKTDISWSNPENATFDWNNCDATSLPKNEVVSGIKTNISASKDEKTATSVVSQIRDYFNNSIMWEKSSCMSSVGAGELYGRDGFSSKLDGKRAYINITLTKTSDGNFSNVVISIYLETSLSTVTPTVSLTTQPTSIISPIPNPIINYYENDRIKLNIPSGWIYKALKDNSGKAIGVVLLKGNYTLNIISHADHDASGVGTGRWDSVASYLYAPELRMGPGPMSPCTNFPVSANLPQFTTEVLSLNNLYFNPDMENGGNMVEQCGNSNKKSYLWYGSYLTSYTGGYRIEAKDLGFNINSNLTGSYPYMIMTMSYYTTNINNLPTKEDPSLNPMINEMSYIIGSIQYKAQNSKIVYKEYKENDKIGVSFTYPSTWNVQSGQYNVAGLGRTGYYDTIELTSKSDNQAKLVINTTPVEAYFNYPCNLVGECKYISTEYYTIKGNSIAVKIYETKDGYIVGSSTGIADNTTDLHKTKVFEDAYIGTQKLYLSIQFKYQKDKISSDIYTTSYHEIYNILSTIRILN
ncbi:MAG: hypothetical protein WCJ19_02470 [bacterium]